MALSRMRAVLPAAWLLEPFTRARGAASDVALRHSFLVLFDDVAQMYREDLMAMAQGGHIILEAGPLPDIFLVCHPGDRSVVQRVLLIPLDERSTSPTLAQSAQWFVSSHERIALHSYRIREGGCGRRADLDPPSNVEVVFIPVLKDGQQTTVPVRIHGVPRSGEVSLRFLLEITDRLIVIGHADSMDWAQVMKTQTAEVKNA